MRGLSGDPALPPQKLATIDALTGIRTIAATWVVIEHFRYQIYGLLPDSTCLAPWINSGFLGVEVFFVLSGFIISYNYAVRFSSFTRSAYSGFLVNRFARIYPVHLVTLLAVALLVAAASITATTLTSAGNYTVMSFPANVALLQALPGVQAWNGPAWSISAEAGAYLVFPLIALALRRIGNRWTSAMFAAVWLAGGTALMMFALTLSDSPTSPRLILLRIATEFTAGCFLWKFWSQSARPESLWWDGITLIVAVTVIVLLGQMGVSEGRPLLLTPLLALFVLGCASASGPAARVLSTKAMKWGGRVSYSLYMTHFLVLMVVGKLVPWENYANSPLLVRAGLIAGYLFACYFAAWGCYRTIEEPGRKMVRQFAGRRSLVSGGVSQ